MLEGQIGAGMDDEVIQRPQLVDLDLVPASYQGNRSNVETPKVKAIKMGNMYTMKIFILVYFYTFVNIVCIATTLPFEDSLAQVEACLGSFALPAKEAR